jgi:hypothetical protein
MRYAISFVVNFYNAGVVTRDRRIGSKVDKLRRTSTFPMHFRLLENVCLRVSTLYRL